MKPIYFYLLFLSSFLAFSSCNNPSQNKDKNKSVPENQLPSYYKHFEGTINQQKVILNLIKSQSSIILSPDNINPQYSGSYLPNKENAPLTISGYRVNDSIVQLVTFGEYNPMDTLTGQFFGDTLRGEFSSENGQNQPFTFIETYPKGTYHWEVHTLKDTLFAFPSDSSIKATADLMMLWPADSLSPDQKALFEDTISQAFFGIGETISSPEKLLKTAADSFFLNYQNVVADFAQQNEELTPTFNWEYLAYMNITCNQDYKLSLIYTQYQYSGGAHGLQTTFGHTVDLNTGQTLQLSDIFKTGYEDSLQIKLENKFRKQYEIPKNEPLNAKNGLLFDEHLKLTSNFYLTPYGIGFIYNPYEVAPYAVGRINLYLPFPEVKDLLKK